MYNKRVALTDEPETTLTLNLEKRKRAQSSNFNISIHIWTKQTAVLQVKCYLANAPALWHLV